MRMTTVFLVSRLLKTQPLPSLVLPVPSCWKSFCVVTCSAYMILQVIWCHFDYVTMISSASVSSFYIQVLLIEFNFSLSVCFEVPSSIQKALEYPSQNQFSLIKSHLDSFSVASSSSGNPAIHSIYITKPFYWFSFMSFRFHFLFHLFPV